MEDRIEMQDFSTKIVKNRAFERLPRESFDIFEDN